DISQNALARRLAITFVCGEEHRAVPDDRSTERTPELVEADLGFQRCARQEWITGGEYLTLVVLECRSMEIIRARTADHIDLSADRAPVLRRQDALGDLHFRDGLDAHNADLI